jgi:nitrous oxidase accessory protein NosD
VGITGLAIVGNAEAIQITGEISGMISENKIVALGEKGVGGIWLKGTLSYLVISNNLIALGQTGIHLENVSPSSKVKPGLLVSDPTYGVWVIGNEIQNIQNISFPWAWAGNGVVLYHANGVAIIRNRISSNTLGGVFAGDAQTILMSENTLAANGFGVWIALPANFGVKLLKNRIIANGIGINIGFVLSLEIESNTISDSRSDGISALRLPPYSYPLIAIDSLQGNVIEHNQGYGIDLDPQVIRIVTCKNNQVSSNRKGDYSSEELRAKCGG